MSKITKILLIAVAVVLVVAGGVVAALLMLGGNNSTPDQPTGDTATYTIEVKSASGILLKDVGLFVYEDKSMRELVTFVKTNESGAASFTDVALDTYVAVLEKVPTGYVAEEYYPLTGELTEIVLQTGKMDETTVENLTYKLGDAVLDFTVVGPDGTEYTLSEMFKGKKAVVLNFFYNNCQPCMLEFPFLQEAYAEYSDSIAVLAMNPVDGSNESIAALQKEMGITFPMVKCGEEWAKIMQLTAYPTTVIIDRFGNICLIHVGSVPNAKTFKDAFAYFAAEEYEQKLINSIDDLKTEEPEGTEENPTEVGGQDSFEVTVEPGQELHYDLYKVTNKYMQIASEYAYVIYNGQTYKPKNGVVSLMVSAPDSFTPAKLIFGNTSTEKLTFTVYLSSLRGSFDNPYAMELGEVKVNVAAGNEQGVYYTYTPQEDGTLTLQCLSATGGVKYSYFLFNTVTSAMRNLEADAVTGANGEVTVSVTAKKGQLIQICFSTLPDSNNSYPAASFVFKATFEAGEVKEQVVVKKTDFTVTVLDDANQPIPNVNLTVTPKDPQETTEQQTAFSTDKEGVAYISLLPGTYVGKLIVPDGYIAKTTEFELKDEAPNVTLKLEKIKKADYTVKVVTSDGIAVENVDVRIGSEGTWRTTDANGTVTENLDVADYTVVVFTKDYSYEPEYSFPKGSTQLVITLQYPEGSQKNPIKVTAYPFATVRLSGGDERYYSFAPVKGVAGFTIRDAEVYIRDGETTHGADAKGVLTYTFDPAATEPVVLAIGNGGETRKAYTVSAVYAVGSEKNPYVVKGYPATTPTIAAGDSIYVKFKTVDKVLGFSVADADVSVLSGETEILPTEGVLTYTFVEENAVLVVKNNASQEKTFTIEAVLPPVGSEANPYVVDAYPNTIPTIAAGESMYVQFKKVDKVIGFTVADADVSVFYGEFETLPTEGVLTYSFMEANSVLIVKNNGTEEKAFTFESVLPPVGSEENPQEITKMGNLGQLKLTAGDTDGYYYSYTTQVSGKLTLRLLQAVSTPHEIEMYTNNRYACKSLDGDSKNVTIEMEAGQTVIMHVFALADATTGDVPALSMRPSLSFQECEVEPLPVEPEPPETEETETEETEPEETEPEEILPPVPDDEFEYKVTVTDIFGGGQSGISVMFMKDGQVVDKVNTNKNGVAIMYTEVKETYTVELGFNGKEYYYDKAAAVLTAENRELTIKLTANVDENDYEPLYILNDNPAYNLYVGGTRVQLGMGKPNFSAEYENNCYFLFTPQEAGTYQISVAPNVTLSFWGTPFNAVKNTDYVKDNAITFSISTGSVKHTTYIIGIRGDTAVVDAVVNIALIGPPNFSIADEPWTEWQSGLTHTDAWKSEVGLTAAPGDAYFTLSKAHTYMDITAASGTYSLWYDAANGYYRLGKNGPIVLVDLNATGRFVPLYERLYGNGQYGGSAVTGYFFDESGKFIKKENYSDYLTQCFNCVNLDSISEQGYHPLTKDLMYVLQNGFSQWWDSTSGNYLEGFASANPEYAWMFACCYVQ